MRGDLFAFIGVIFLFFIAYALYKKFKNEPKSGLQHSSLKSFPQHQTLKTKLSSLPSYLLLGSLLLGLIAFLDPHTFLPRERNSFNSPRDPTEGKLLMLALDQSGSMKEPASSQQSKMDLMKEVMIHFIEGRPDDLIGAISFARAATILSPPTLDHKALIKLVSLIEAVPSPEVDGTSIGYAMYKTANLIVSLKEQSAQMGNDAPYDIKGAVIILVTDGLQDPNPLDKDNPYRSMEMGQAAAYIHDHGIKLYIVNIEPKLSTTQYLPNLKEMERIAQLTGGKFYHMSRGATLSDFIEEINQVESSQFNALDASTLPTLYERISYYFGFLVSSALLFILALFLKSTWLRKVSE